MPEQKIVFLRFGEWTGVYVDGLLDRCGDHYLADEWLQQKFGVEVIDSDAWVPDGRNPLRTLDQVHAEEDRRSQLLKRAEQLRHEASAALDAAAEFERQAGTKT